MKAKKVLLVGSSFALVAALAVGGTVSYLKDDDKDVNVMTMGNVSIAQHEYERVVNADGSYETVVSPKYGEGYKIQEFTQAKPLYPATGKITGWGDAVPFDQLGDNATGSQKVLDGIKNVQDKFVLVENTGKSDAYVRTIFAFEIGSVAPEEWSDIIMTNTDVAHYSWSWLGAVNIDGNNYYLAEAVYTGSSSGTRHANGVLPAGDYTYNSLAQLYMTSAADNEDVEAVDGNNNGTYDVLVLSQAVQTNGFDNAVDALNEAFGTTAENAATWFEGTVIPAYANGANDMDNILQNGGDLFVEQDIDTDIVEVDANADVNIDLQGNTLSTDGGLVNSGTAVVKNGTLESSSTEYGTRTSLGANTTYNDLDLVTSGGGVNAWGTAVWNSGTITTNSLSTSHRHVFYVGGGDEADGHLTINDGEFIFSPTNLTRKGSYICAQGEGATVIVNGGKFHKPSTRTAPIQAVDGATVTIYGGTFAFDPSAFVAEGYQAVEADGWWTVSAI